MFYSARVLVRIAVPAFALTLTLTSFTVERVARLLA